jgi:hypothetical protein
VELTFSPLRDVVDGRLELRGGLGGDPGERRWLSSAQKKNPPRRRMEGGVGVQEVAMVAAVAPVSSPRNG